MELSAPNQNQQGYLNPQQAQQALSDQQMRREMAHSFLGFCIVYLSHYLTLKPAKFHHDLIGSLENYDIKFLEVVGFRGSAKSSFASLALPLWAGLEEQERYPFILPFSDTTPQAALTIANIRHELENNFLIKEDYGDLSEGISKQKEWTKTALLLKNGTRIMARSRGQRIRGLRHRQFRPALIVIDDPEELEKVQNKEYRDKTERWLRSDVIPAIEETGARLIVVGNILHTDALMARLKNDPIFEHREYPLIDANGKCTWEGKYPTEHSLKQQEAKVGHNAWLREYLLKVVPPEGQEVKEEWIQYYDKIPQRYIDKETKQEINPILQAGEGVDLAISKKETADFTSMVGGITAEVEGTPKLFILPNPVNARLSFHETIQQMKSTSAAMAANLAHPIFFIEDVAYQRAAIEEAIRHGIPAIPMKVGKDKRARLRAAATFIQNGIVLFPRKGAEDLIAQLCGFGIEDHDDLCDAFVYLVLGMRSEGMQKPEVIDLLE